MAALHARSHRRATKASASKRKTPSAKKWSSKVMQQSDAMDLKAGVFKLKSASAVARSLKRSSEASHRRKASPFRSAMSMLNFEINRAGSTLSANRLRVLNAAKQELRRLFGRPPQP
jgi:hypothetical protein